MLTIRREQWDAVLQASEQVSLQRVAHFLLAYGGLPASQTLDALIPLCQTWVDDARQFGFRTEREAAAYALAVVRIGRDALLQTQAFAQAAFAVSAEPSARAELLLTASREAPVERLDA